MSFVKTGGNFGAMGVSMAFFAGIMGSFYYSRFWAHNKDDQTWITRHGQQPGNPMHPFAGDRLVLTSNYVEPARGPALIPLPDNDDNRGSSGVVGRVMSVVAGRGFHPNGLEPKNPTNIKVPPQQRTNAAHSHFYTKNLPFDVKAWNAEHRAPKVRVEETVTETRVKTVSETVAEAAQESGLADLLSLPIQDKITEALEKDTQVA